MTLQVGEIQTNAIIPSKEIGDLDVEIIPFIVVDNGGTLIEVYADSSLSTGELVLTEREQQIASAGQGLSLCEYDCARRDPNSVPVAIERCKALCTGAPITPVTTGDGTVLIVPNPGISPSPDVPSRVTSSPFIWILLSIGGIIAFLYRKSLKRLFTKVR
mgnify:FL=1